MRFGVLFTKCVYECVSVSVSGYNKKRHHFNNDDDDDYNNNDRDDARSVQIKFNILMELVPIFMDDQSGREILCALGKNFSARQKENWPLLIVTQ